MRASLRVLKALRANGSMGPLSYMPFLVRQCRGCAMRAKFLMWLRKKLLRPMNARTSGWQVGGGMSRKIASFSGLNSFWREHKPQISHFRVSETEFGKIEIFRAHLTPRK